MYRAIDNASRDESTVMNKIFTTDSASVNARRIAQQDPQNRKSVQLVGKLYNFIMPRDRRRYALVADLVDES